MVLKAVCFASAIVLSLAAGAKDVTAQGYPSRPVTVLNPNAAGGSADAVVNPVLDELSKRLGQRFVNEHRPGASSTIATQLAARAKPDGHTLLIGTVGGMMIVPLMRKVEYDPKADLTPVAWLGTVSSGLAVSPTLGVNSLAELIALAKQKPGEIAFVNAGIGSTAHLRGVMLEKLAGIKLKHVSYNGNSEAIPDLLGGQVHLMIESIVFPHVKNGKLKLLAVLDNRRHAEFPDVPTMAEAGLPAYDVPLWYTLYAPAKVPEAILEQLNKEVTAITSEASFQEKMRTLNLIMSPNSRAGTVSDMAKQHALFESAAKAAELVKE